MCVSSDNVLLIRNYALYGLFCDCSYRHSRLKRKNCHEKHVYNELFALVCVNPVLICAADSCEKWFSSLLTSRRDVVSIVSVALNRRNVFFFVSKIISSRHVLL